MLLSCTLSCEDKRKGNHMADINMPKEYLEEALQLIDTLDADKAAFKTASAETEKLEAAFDTLKKNISKEKERTVSARRADVENSFDKQIKAKNSEIEAVRSKRSKAREAGVNSRVETQTAGLKEEINSLKESLVNYCRLNKLPSLCSTGFFYSIYYPSGLGDWLRLIIAAVIMVAAIIGAHVYGDMKVFIGVIAAVIVIIAIYVSIGARIKGKYSEQLANCRSIVANIRLDKKSIANITRNIRNDQSDAAYDLGSFDSDIANKNQECESLMTQKLQALSRFDAETKQQLIAEIDTNYGDKLRQAEESWNKARQQLDAAKARIAESENRLNTEFVQYIGSRNLNHDTVSRMIELIAGGRAATVSDAIAKLNESESGAQTEK